MGAWGSHAGGAGRSPERCCLRMAIFFPLTCSIFQMAFNTVALKASWNVRNENKGKQRERQLTPALGSAPGPFG